MKKFIKNIAFLSFASLLAVSCDYDDTNFDALTNKIDSNATYFVQFADAERSLETAVDLEGNLVDIETTVDIALLGAPLSTDVVVDLIIEPTTNIDPSMYNLSATSVTIPAGATSGSVTLTTNTELMPVGETFDFDLTLDAGEHNATAGTDLNYDLKRIEFCVLENGVADLVGPYNVIENGSGYENGFTATQDGENLIIDGLAQDFIAGFWGEPVIAGGSFTMEIAPNGEMTIPRQYIYTTTWDGNPYEYEIEGSGIWRNCGAKPVMELTYDIYYPGDLDGLAKTYSAYLPNPYLGGSFGQ